MSELNKKKKTLPNKTFRMNLILESEILLLKIENWATLFQDWLNFHSRMRFHSKEFLLERKHFIE